MYVWSDMNTVKKQLWKKLHAAKDLMKKQVTKLAQVTEGVVTTVGAHLPE